MSRYSFIATDYEIPEVKNSKERIITVQEAIELGVEAHKFMPWEKIATKWSAQVPIRFYQWREIKESILENVR